MTIRRAALYIGGAVLLAAWLASAASMSFQAGPGPSAASASTPEDDAMDAIAAGVHANASRLRERLAAAPPPQQPLRNPFVFRTEASPRPPLSARRFPLQQPAPAYAPPEPALAMIGMAEQQRPEGVARTAMVVVEGNELIVAAVGDVILNRYTVTAISPDAMELADTATGAPRRLLLQYQ